VAERILPHWQSQSELVVVSGSPDCLLLSCKRQTVLDSVASGFGGKGASVCESGATWRERELLSRQPHSLPPSLPWWHSLHSWRPAETENQRHGGREEGASSGAAWGRSNGSSPAQPLPSRGRQGGGGEPKRRPRRTWVTFGRC